MKVIDLRDRSEIDVPEEYGARLIEQGLAVPAPSKSGKAAPNDSRKGKK